MNSLAHRCLASCLAALLVFDSTALGWWAHHCAVVVDHCVPMTCEPVSCHPVPCGPVSRGPSHCGDGCSDTASCHSTRCIDDPCVAASDCCATVHEPCVGDTASPVAVHRTPAQSSPQPTTVYEPALPADAFGSGGFRSDSPEELSIPPAPPEAPDAWTPPTDPQPTLVAEPMLAPADPAPMADPEPMPVDDLEAEDDSVGGFFGPEPEAEPEAMPEPAAEEDDLFGGIDDPMADDAFAAEPAETDALDSAPMDDEGDLFGDDDMNDGGFDDGGFDEGGFEEPFAEPMPEPAPAQPEATQPEPMQPQPAPADAEDDLFGDDFGDADAFDDNPDGDADFGDGFDAPAEPAEDLFGAPAEDASMPVDDGPADNEDDLFGFGDEPAEEMPADDFGGNEFGEQDAFGDDAFGDESFDEGFDAAPTDDAEPAEDFDAEDDLFGGFGVILREPGGFASAADRTWVDNTGRFSCVGRLLAIDGPTVRVAKHDGGVATVPLARLSQADLEFVSRQAIASTERDDATSVADSDESPELPLRTASR